MHDKDFLSFNVKCKDLNEYGIKITNLADGPKIISTKPMSGGFAEPQGLFRVENDNQTQTQEASYDFSQSATSVNWPMIKLSLYPHAKEFIQKQELVGNIV
jgi:hypothetical protein